jgi:hypothetical protein
MRWWFAFVVVAGCGPRIVVDEDGNTGSSSTSDTPSPTTSDDDASNDTSGGDGTTGMLPDPVTSADTTAIPSTAGDSTGDEPDLPCPELEDESARCIFLLDSSVYVVGMDSGLACEVVNASHPIRATSIVWDFESIYLCNADDDNTLASVDLVTGEVTRTDRPCRSVVDVSGSLLVEPDAPEPWRLYQSFEDVLTETEYDILDINPQATRFTGFAGLLYGAWHSTNSVERWDLDNDVLIDVLTLQDYDDWVHGLAVVGARLFVLAGNGDTILVFDDDTGEREGEVLLDGISSAQGLACR